MKKINLLSFLFLTAALGGKITAMELALPQKIKTAKVTSAPAITTPLQISESYLNIYTNIGAIPYAAIGQLTHIITKKEWGSQVDNLRKNNPLEFALLQKKNIDLTGQPISVAIPANYLVDKKPDDIVMYEGYGYPDSLGIKISEREGSKVVASLVRSAEKTDPRFQDLQTQYVITQEFCEQTNRKMEKIEAYLIKEENKKYKRKIGDNPSFIFTGRRIAGEKTGITSGWNGGKTLTDVEDRSPSIRSR
jgi:hypothetical protein